MSLFSDFPLRKELAQAIADIGFETPTPIQSKIIPLLLEQPTNIIGLAQTGTGKTAAFGFPLLHKIDTSSKETQALVLSPTRELCMQIQNEFAKYGQHLKNFRSVAVYGGVPIGGQIRELKSSAQVIVATPGRLIDLMERKVINLETVQYVVLDEADEMLNMGFRDDISLILKSTPIREYTWLFSATMSNDVRNIAKKYMKDWKEISVNALNSTNENIDHQYFVTNHHNRFETLQRLLDFSPGLYGIIFTRTKNDCQEISEKLTKLGYHVSPLHGDMDQKMRSKVLERFKTKQLQTIVATDVAARGIDVNDITHIINYELPDDTEVYTHRSGRTARAGKSGICLSIVTPREISTIRNIERIVKKQFTKCDIPEGADIIRKKLFYSIEQLSTQAPTDSFIKNYQSIIDEQLSDITKDELIQSFLWLQLKNTIFEYENSNDLNAGFNNENSKSTGNTKRFFINLGEKDGLNTDRLLQFIYENTDIERNLITRVTVKETCSFFNIRTDAAVFIQDLLSNKKFKNRKVRLDESSPLQGKQTDYKKNNQYPSSNKNSKKGERGGARFDRFDSKSNNKKSYAKK